ncbi:MAG: FAD-dependent oxidoreductase [Salinisphaera sp.]|jgi:rubredoxin-NAD+ reductase|nr:FAD-dependent oxidoreductase [Salinisphaera sp.]
MTIAKLDPIIVVGSGLAGYTLIRQLRQFDAARPVVLITADGGEVYSKPLLSNALAKHETPETLVQKTAEDKAQELNVVLVNRCRALSIDAERRIVKTTRGDFAYSDLVLATGASQRIILPDHAERDWLDTVNDLDDYRRWYQKLGHGAKRVLLIGAGLIGSEFADDLMSRDVKVDLVDPAPWPLARLLPEAIGQRLAENFDAAGARLHMGRYVKQLDRNHCGSYTARLDNGERLTCDLVLSAVGLVPQTELAASAGLAIGRGIRVDDRLATTDPHIYAMGDCAETRAGVLPYILPLMAQAKVLAQVLAGAEQRLFMKAMPVTVKTTSLSLVVCPPNAEVDGHWSVDGHGDDCAAVFHDINGAPQGFALSGTTVARRGEFGRLMPALLA